MWVEVEGPWELNRRKEAKALVWEGAEMSLGFDRQRRASFSDDGKQKRRRRANATMVKAMTASKSDNEQAKATSTANDLAATVNDSVRSSRMGSLRMGIGKRDRCEWVRCWDVVNGFDIGIVWMLRMGCEGESEGKREVKQ